MKRFLFKVFYYAFFVFLLMVVLPYLIDPFNVFHYAQVRQTGVGANLNYIKMKFILDNPQKYDSFMFGSSRVGVIHTEKIKEKKCYNMFYNGGIPNEHYNNILTLLKNNIRPNVVYLGVDSLSYTADPIDHINSKMFTPYEYLTHNKIQIYKTYCDFKIIYKSMREIIKNKRGTHEYDELYTNGWWLDYGYKPNYDWNNAMPSIGDYRRIDEAIKDIENIVNVCKYNKIKIVVFTNPMYRITHEASLNRDYLMFLKKLSKVTNYYNFSGYNNITNNNNNFCDASHYNAETGDLMMDVMVNGKTNQELLEQGFGYYVTKDNIEELLEILDRQKMS